MPGQLPVPFTSGQGVWIRAWVFFLYFTRLAIMPDRSETSGTNLLRQVFDKMERQISDISEIPELWHNVKTTF